MEDAERNGLEKDEQRRMRCYANLIMKPSILRAQEGDPGIQEPSAHGICREVTSRS